MQNFQCPKVYPEKAQFVYSVSCCESCGKQNFGGKTLQETSSLLVQNSVIQ